MMNLSRRSIFALIAGALASPAMARVKPFATGGVVPAGRAYVIGEIGRELGLPAAGCGVSNVSLADFAKLGAGAGDMRFMKAAEDYLVTIVQSVVDDERKAQEAHHILVDGAFL